MAEQTRGKDAGVVDDQEIARNEIVTEPRELGVFERSGFTMQDKQP
jgi:hypothetical protein